MFIEMGKSITIVIITLIALTIGVYIFLIYYIVIKFMYYLSDFKAANNSVCIEIVKRKVLWYHFQKVLILSYYPVNTAMKEIKCKNFISFFLFNYSNILCLHICLRFLLHLFLSIIKYFLLMECCLLLTIDFCFWLWIAFILKFSLVLF